VSKNIVICCDGTGNEVEGNLSNVLKLFRIAQRNEHQRVYYNPGIGTIGSRDAWMRLKQNTALRTFSVNEQPADGEMHHACFADRALGLSLRRVPSWTTWGT